jgi:hypothetical protein
MTLSKRQISRSSNKCRHSPTSSFLISYSIVITTQTGRQTRSNVYFCSYKKRGRTRKRQTTPFFFLNVKLCFHPEKGSKCISSRHKQYSISNLDNRSILTLNWRQIKQRNRNRLFFIDLHSNFKTKRLFLQKKGNNTHTHTYI